ncbi:hypothetical protein F4813DRAFT_395185 [Daldinia decipiens]|uniref:uncharacterized protein n=1 Tax=Daldinia decipiens TaxID=326647 RepID=UPI0020C3C93E|nr:uncharacterized protein F4813DRAFT_395185 [Daldinia decipiens]KAI1659265.1 hypothetical protein F4813DRAFT_395185 [Daldinia decipiens]
MAGLLNGAALSAIESIIKEQVESKLLNLDPDQVIKTLLRRQDSEDLRQRILSQLDKDGLMDMIEAREDSNTIYVDILKRILSKVPTPSHIEQEHSRNNTSISEADPPEANINAVQTSPSNELTVPQAIQIPGEKGHSFVSSPKYSNTDMSAGSADHIFAAEENSDSNIYDYTASGLAFEPQIPHLDAWVPMFMSEDEFYRSGPSVEEIRSTVDMGGISDRFFIFIKLLNPPYLCCRAEQYIRWAGSDRTYVLPKLDTTPDIVKAWNKATNPRISYIAKALVAVKCYEKSIEVKNTNYHEHQSSADSSTDSKSIEKDTSQCILPELLRAEPKKTHVNEQKWPNIIEYGKRLSSLLEDFGGQPFLSLFPLSELNWHIGYKALVNDEAIQHVWEPLNTFMKQTGLGQFFRSLSHAVGDILHRKFLGEDTSSFDFRDRLALVFDEYSLKGILSCSPRPSLLPLSIAPSLASLVYCGRVTSLTQLNSESSLSPKSLLGLVDGVLDEDIIRHLIQQRLPNDWAILGRSEMSKVASEDLLLHSFRGIIIPLCIDDGWVLICYENPRHTKVSYPITIINPTTSDYRFQAVLYLLSKWIPEREDWIPKDITVQHAKNVKYQAACERDSGVHIVLSAIAMANSGVPETRPLDRKVCRALCMRYFITTLNEVQQAVSKAARKRAGEGRV